MLCDEESSTVQGVVGFVEDAGERLEDVGDVRGDVEDRIDPGRSCATTTWECDLFDDLVRCETRLYNHLDDQLRSHHGLVTSQYEFLRFVRDHPAARVADLAAEFAVGVGATIRGCDRLEGRGWLTRSPNPADRRSTVLALTDKGSSLSAALAAIPGRERTSTARALAALRVALSSGRAHGCCSRCWC